MKSFDRNVDGYYDVENQLPRYLRTQAEEQFEQAQTEREQIDDLAAAEDHVERARTNFIDALGGLPKSTAPLDAKRAGTLERDGYSIEMIVFESLPGFHVTSNLYLPAAARHGDSEDDNEQESTDAYPGILFLCGHTDVGKAAPVYQQVCIDLVRNGFVVLAIDPLGQGERHQFYDPTTGELPRENTVEHSYLNQQCAFAGANVARYFVWDGMRALDYLIDRPEVDSDQIGATGNSGGGMQTGYLMLTDDRIDAAAPCCFVTAKEDYMETGQAQDGEQILYRAIDRGPRYDDFLTAFAPKPALVGAARSDFLCLEGTKRTVERARRVYGLYGADEALELSVADETHGFSPHLRESTVNWFREHLAGKPPDFETGDPATVDPGDLRCTPDGEVLATYPDETTVTELNRAHIEQTAPNAGSVPDVDDHDAYVQTTRETVINTFDLDAQRGALYPRHYDAETVDGITWEKTFFLSERDPPVVVTGVVARDGDDLGDRTPLVLLYEDGTDEVPSRTSEIADLVADHGLVLTFDPRGVGGVEARDVNTPLMNGGEYHDCHGTVDKLASDALMLGTSLVGLQTYDVLRACEYVRTRLEWDGDAPLSIEGHGASAYLALLAAVVDDSLRSITLADPIESFYNRATARERDIEYGQTVHGVVGTCDIPQLLPALSDRKIVWQDADPIHYE